jgi:hypothetical protein
MLRETGCLIKLERWIRARPYSRQAAYSGERHALCAARLELPSQPMRAPAFGWIGMPFRPARSALPAMPMRA